MGELMEVEMMEYVVNWIRSHYFGKYRGTVSDNSDSTSRGRLKVKVPAVLGDLEVWAMPCVPYAGDGVGFYSLPPQGAGVWVEFEAGDPSYPIWTGCFWADGEIPDSNDANIKIWKTDKLTLRLDDSASEMKLQNDKESKITLSDDVKTESGEATHTVGSDGVVSEQGTGKVEVSTSGVSVNDGALEVA
jgi:uncharacterized protein involved in type VI secretion and phage assembly